MICRIVPYPSMHHRFTMRNAHTPSADFPLRKRNPHPPLTDFTLPRRNPHSLLPEPTVYLDCTDTVLIFVLFHTLFCLYVSETLLINCFKQTDTLDNDECDNKWFRCLSRRVLHDICGRLAKIRKCSPNRAHKFTWTLFTHVLAESLFANRNATDPDDNSEAIVWKTVPSRMVRYSSLVPVIVNKKVSRELPSVPANDISQIFPYDQFD